MSHQPSAKLFAVAAIARNPQLSRCVLPGMKNTEHLRIPIIRELPLIVKECFSSDYELVVRQKPHAAKVFLGKEKDRKPIDPPPIIQLRINEYTDPSQSYLQSPYLFLSCNLMDNDETRSQSPRVDLKNALAGNLVSSLHRLKDTDNNDGGFFVFGDLSVRLEGTFKLQFTLYEVRDSDVAFIKSISSGPFTVHASKNWPGMAESTFLTRSFSDQGVRLRLRKEPRSRLGARGPASDNYEPRRYRIHNRKSSQTEITQSQASQQTSQTYDQGHGSGGSQRQAHIDYQGRQQQQQPVPPQSPLLPGYQRKRDFSNSSHSGSYASYGDEPTIKRTKAESEYAQQVAFGQQQYSLSPDYANKLYSYPNQVTNFGFTQSPHQLYNSNYNSSPLSMTPREQGNYYVPRRSDTQYPSISSNFEPPSGRLLTSQPQRSPSAGQGFASSLQPLQQSTYNFQQQQQQQQQQQPQYIPQVSQPIPPSRAPPSMPIYPMHLDPDQSSMLSRPTNLVSNDMLPPVFGRGTMVGMGNLNSTIAQLPSMGEDPKYSKTYRFDFKPGEDNPNR